MDSSYTFPSAAHNESIDVLQVLLNVTSDKDLVSPSKYMAEMKMNAEERLEKLRKSKLGLESNITAFDVSPDIVIFQNFKRGVIYSSILSLRNTQKISRPLRLVFEDSPYFTISYASESISTHIAPGMSLHFNVKFCAEDVRDYKYQIKFVTEGEEFTVSIIAISPRPLLDFPDHLHLPNCGVKLGSTCTVLIRNLGHAPAIFSMQTEAPFFARPERGILLSEETMQLIVDFKPQKLGLIAGHLVVSYENGEKICIMLQGYAMNLNISLEKGSLQFRNTFIGLTRQRNIKLLNNSNHIVNFQWKLYSSSIEDEEHAQKLKNSFRFLKENETIKSNTLETYSVVDADGHSKIYNRIYEDEIEEFGSENQFLYRNPYFQIIPLIGEVWPGGTFDFTIIFSPTAVCQYSESAFLEITGRIDRLKFFIHGEGIGPEIKFNLDCLNANTIYMRAVHQYEIAAINKGDIPGDIRYKPRKPEFGGQILCWPSNLHLEPNECGNFVLEFSSRTQGTFLEEIHFEIVQSEEIKRQTTKVYRCRGEIICPLLSFDISEIDFGSVPLGYPVRFPVVLNNPAMIPIDFEVFVPSDGEIAATTCEEFATLPVKCGLAKNPREFDYFPRTGSVPANSSLCIELTLIANITRQNSTIFTANLWGSDKYSISLPVKYKACVPHISCVPAEVNIRFCFVQYTYNRTITLRNDSQFPGFFQVLPQKDSVQGGITCTPYNTEGFLKPYGEAEIHVLIMTTFLGEDKLPFLIKLFGGIPMQCCTIVCNGQGPVITVQPEKMLFGNVTLLETTTREIRVCNDSPIVAFVDARISPKSLFVVEPKLIRLEPEQCRRLNVTVYLTNPFNYKEKLYLDVENGSTILCPIAAKGVGTSILCEPKIHPHFNVGTFLTYRKFLLEVRFTNKGLRAHKMLWSRNPNLKQLKEDREHAIPSVFTITPNEFELASKESVTASLEGRMTKAGNIEEDFYCHAIIEKSKKQTVIMSFIITATFVEPSVEMSKSELEFWQNVGPDNVTDFLEDDVTITNQSGLAIEIDIHLQHPFYMLLDGERRYYINAELKHQEKLYFIVAFDPHTDTKRCCVEYQQLLLNYRNHPKVDKIKLTGKINYPNIEISPGSIKLPCLPTNASDYCEIKLTNISPLPVTYHFEWQEETSVIEKIHHKEMALPGHESDSSFSRTSSDSGIYLKELETRKTNTFRDLNESELHRTQDSKGTLLNVDELDMDIPLQYGNLPVEYYSQRSYLEIHQNYHYTQIQDVIASPVYAKDLVDFPKRSQEYLTALRTFLTTALCRHEDTEYDADILKTLPKPQTPRCSVDSVLDLTPIRGYLQPYESQLLSIVAHPLPNVSFAVQAQCHVIGGATESLDIRGEAADLSYTIDYIYVDFGRQVFCDKCDKTIVLTNTGYLEFNYVNSAKEFPEPISSELLLEVGCLTVSPKFGLLLPGESAKLLIQYFPGIAGEFKEVFEIKIGYLPPLTITVHGYGVFPQAYLALPRPSLATLSPYITYLAVAGLTPDYLKSLNNVKNIMHYDGMHVYDEDIPKGVRDVLKADDWIIISHNDFYPSTMDIDLAIERMLFYQHFLNNPTVLSEHTKTHKAIIVPHFIIPPYLVDFGYVIVNNVAYYTVRILNYGPVNADVKIVPGVGKKSAFESAGLAVQFCRSIIAVGETRELFINFLPTLAMYPELDFEINYPFHLDVGHGPRIPVYVKAVVTVPTVSPNLFCLDFGEVECGSCMKRSLILSNRGHVESEWHAMVTKYEKKRNHTGKSRTIFFLKLATGTLKVGASCLLDVYFEPHFEGHVAWSLILTTEQNPEELVITLAGVGLKPTLRIIEEVLEFEPVLPYVHKCQKFFTIENVSSFPIEFYFADFDFEIDEEERILNLLMQYYGLNDIYIPYRAAGQKLPHALIDFYFKIVDSLREKLIRVEKDKIYEDNLNIPSAESLTQQNSNKRSSMSNKKKLTSRSKSLVHYAAEGMEFMDPLTTIESKDMETLLKEHLDELKNSTLQETKSSDELALDPVNAAILEAKVPVEVDPTALKDGVFIIFHGGPSTKLKEAANKAGLEVGLPVYSIDRLYYESLANNSSVSAVAVNELIDKEFKAVASEIDLLKPVGTDEYDELQKKVNLLLSGKEKKAKPKPEKAGGKDSKKGKKDSAKSSSKKSSSKGSKKEKKKKVDNRPTFLGISEVLLFEILHQRLSLFQTGVVIESLDSVFLRQPFLAFNHLLRAIGNVKYIHCIILSYTYADNKNFQESLKQAVEKQQSNEREALLSKFLQMDSDQFAKLSPEEAAVFKEFIVKQRKENSLLKREALKKRILEAKLCKKLALDKIPKTSEKKTSPPGGKGDSAKSKKSEGDKKSSKKSKGSSKSSAKAKPKLSPEEAEQKRLFDVFETDVLNMMHVLEYWDRKTSTCLKPLPLGKGSKGKGSASKKQSKSSKGSNKPSKKNLNESAIGDVVATPKEVAPLSPEEELKTLQTGIPCWLVSNAHKDKPVTTMVANYLHHTPELRKAVEDLEDSFKEHLVEVIEFYSVLHKPKKNRTKNPSDIFLLKNGEPPQIRSAHAVENIEDKDRSRELIKESAKSSESRRSLDSKMSLSSKTKKRKNSRSRSKSSRHSMMSVPSAKQSPASLDRDSQKSATGSTAGFTTRVVLNPGEIIQYRIVFIPEFSGYYEHTFTIEIMGWSTKYMLTCQGRCDIPQIDMTPERIFKRVAKKRSPKNMYCNSIFLKELGVFDFGPALIQEGDNLKLLAVETEFHFTNTSLLPCEIIFCLRDDTDSYTYNPDAMTVEPNTTEALSISAIPTAVEDVENQLIISIRNNPKIETINLKSEGTKFNFNVTPKLIHFDRILINHTAQQRFILENESLVPLNWHFLEPENVLEYFKVSELMGCIEANSTQEIVLEYVSEIPEDVPPQALQIVVCDQHFKCESPLYIDIIEISAEATQIIIECLKGIEIGEVKGKFLHTISYTMLNKGKYAVEFAFADVLEDQDESFMEHQQIRSYFKIAPAAGVLQPNKQSTCKLTFFSRKVVDFKNVPIFNCTFTECLYKTVVDTFPLTACAKTFLAGFELCPPEVVNFGSQLVGTEKVQEMTLRNEGKFDFSYSIVSLKKLLEQKAKKSKEGKGNKKGKKESKSSKSSKSKPSTKSDKGKSGKSKGSKNTKGSSKSDLKKKPKPTKLDVGVFSLISSTGTIEPNECVTIQVFSRPKLTGTYQETIVVFISECRPVDSKGRYVNLSVAGCIPSINFTDYDGIFREQYVVNRIADFKWPDVVGAHCIFIKEEVRLHFSQVMINKEATARIRLENIGPIPADVAVRVSSPFEDIFSVQPQRFNVDTYCANYTTISFVPNGIDMFHGLLEIGYDYTGASPSKNFQVKLTGEGLVPEVALKCPEFDHTVGCYAINFNPTFAGATSLHKIGFENVGIVPCQVIIEVCEGTKDAFTLIPYSDTIPFLKMFEKVIHRTAHTNIIHLNPKQVGEFDLAFKPATEGHFHCIVKLHIVDNPFETFMIFVTSVGYVEDVTIKGLSTCSIKNSKFEDTLIFTNYGYELDFGYPFINLLQKKYFKITNSSLTATYKFEFAVSDKLLFVPAVGHLKPNATKEIIATFLSKEPIHLCKEIIECITYQIQYINPDLEPLSWDERQNVSIWEPAEHIFCRSPRSSIISNMSHASDHSKNSSPSRISEKDTEIIFSEMALKTVAEKGEPPVLMISNTSKCIPILFTVMCDYSSYECSQTQIEMTDTLAFEKQSQTFIITNTSNVTLELCWKITMDEIYPRRINSTPLNKLVCPRTESVECDVEIKSDQQLPYDEHHAKTNKSRPQHLTGAEKFIPEELSQPSTSQSSLFSVEANQSDRSNDSWMEGDFIPFVVTPDFVSIPSKESSTFTVTFTPKDVFDYLVHLRSEILNLHPSQKHLDITIKARSLLPLCHFDVGPSDYLSVRRKGQKMCGDIADDNTKVVEIEAIGIGISNTRSFNIINPTGESFMYKWTPADINGNNISLFHCHKTSGFVAKGKMDEAVFSFYPQTAGTFEAFYIFHVEKYNLSWTFLLVGVAREPDIRFSTPHLDTRPTIIGVDVTECVSIKNNENLEADFKFKKESLYSEARLQALTVEPLKGTLQPYGLQQIKITFHPIKKGEVNFNLKCMVEKMQKPLSLSVTANCFAVQPKVFYMSDQGDKIILNSEKINVIQLKSMVPHLRQQTAFTISNTGETGFYFSWILKQDLVDNKVRINFKDAEGYVSSNGTAESVMCVTPLAKVVIKKLKIKLQIRYGPTYHLHLMGSAEFALFAFSVDEYDFGPCLVQKEVTSYYTKTIEFTNNDQGPVTLECRVPPQDHLSINFQTKIIQPKKSEPLVIIFHPHEVGHYYTEVVFYVNSKLHVLKVSGEGVPNSIELKDVGDKFLDLGCVLIGETSTKRVQVVNNGTAPIDIIFDLYERLPYFSRPKKVLKPEFEREEKKTAPVKKVKTDDKKGKKGKGGKDKGSKGGKSSKDDKSSKKTDKKKESGGSKKDKNSKKSSKGSKGSKSSKGDKGGKKDKKTKEKKGTPSGATIAVPIETPEMKEKRLIRSFMTFSPKTFTTVLPQHSTEFAVKFSPTERMKSFTEKVSYQVQDIIETLCLIKGCCVGPDYSLDNNYVAFGNVIYSCCSEKKVVLRNTGDVRGKFRWIFEKGQSSFKIIPMEGVISPDTIIAFKVLYEPEHISCLFETKARCQIDNFKKPLELTLTGSCFDKPHPKELLKLACPVRESDKKAIAITNPTGQTWTITPTVEGQYFSTQEVFTVARKSTNSCEVIYRPLTMSGEKPHEASVFFNLPEGQGVIYRFLGTALPPKPVNVITREITCKTYHDEILTVSNWLSTPQKFVVLTESMMPEVASKTLYKLTGNNAIDVLAQSRREYMWTIYVLNEGTLKFKIIFKNEVTNEYLFYEITLTVTKCPPLDVVKLTTCVRIPTTHVLKLQNPIKTAVVFNIQPTSPELTFENPVTVPPYSEYELKIEYRPLTIGESEIRLNISSNELGLFPYDFVLTAHPPVPEPYVCFTSNLGQRVSQKAFVINPTNSLVDFNYQIEHPDIFYVENHIAVEPRQRGEFEISFEPNCLGNIQSTLTLISPLTGMYIYPLIGRSNLPKPQGPYFIKPGGSTAISFKNPFNETKTFNCAVEPAIFSVKNTSETIKGRKDIKIVPSLVPLKNLEILIDQKYPITGKLVVYCEEPQLSYIKWIYYLQGDVTN